MAERQAKPRVAVLISGRGSNLQSLIEAAAASDYPAEIVRVIANRAEAAGLQRAEAAGIATTVIAHRDYASREAFDAALHETLKEAGAQLVCLAGFMRLLTPGFTERWQGRMLNIHPSLLPAFRGLDTHRRALEAGVRISGCSVHFVVPEVDAGPVVIQAAVPVLPGDDEAALAARVLAQEHRIYPKALRWLARGDVALSQGRVVYRFTPEPSAPLLVPSVYDDTIY